MYVNISFKFLSQVKLKRYHIEIKESDWARLGRVSSNKFESGYEISY